MAAKAENVNLKSTKQKILEAYENIRKELEEKEKQSLNANKKIETKKKTETIDKVSKIVKEGINEKINILKADMLNALDDLSSRLSQAEIDYQNLKAAIEIKDKEIREIYDIERSSLSLASLIEAHNRKTAELEFDYSQRKKKLEEELAALKNSVELDKKNYEKISKGKEAEFKTYWDRKKEESEYNFKRESERKVNQLNDELKKLRYSIKEEKEKFEKEYKEKTKELNERQDKIVKKEQANIELEQKVAAFPLQLKTEISNAVNTAIEKLKAEVELQKAIMHKEYEGKINVLKTKIESLEKVAVNQEKYIETLTSQHEKAYLQVQQIATSAIQSNIDKTSQSKFEQIFDKISKTQSVDK